MNPKLLIGVVAIVVGCSAPQGKNAVDRIDQRVDSLMQKMTLAEKIGQMNQLNGFWDVTGPAPEGGTAAMKYEFLQQGLVGSMLGIKSVKEAVDLQRMVMENSRLGIPLIFGFDVIHGFKTTFPIPLAMAASWDLKAVEEATAVAAKEAASAGVNWTFAPMMDVCRDARWGRCMEGCGEDPFLTTQMALAQINGFQGNDLASQSTIAACAKHFAGYGFSESGRDYNNVILDGATLFNTVLPPFKAAIDAGARTVMCSFNVVNGVPSSSNNFLLRQVLKDSWQFNGFVVSDWASIRETMIWGAAATDAQAAQNAAVAGCDMDMESYIYINNLEALVKNGDISESIIDDACRRILRVKFELGLFDDPYRYLNEEYEQQTLNDSSHKTAARTMAAKSMVLLKNDGGLLPLAANKPQKIALIGPFIDDNNSVLGSWHLAADDSSAVTIYEGFSEVVGNTSTLICAKGADVITSPVTFISRTHINNSDKSGFQRAVNAARMADVVVLALGEHGYQTGEGRSQTDISLPGVQQELLEAVYAANPNVVLVLFSGRPLEISWAAEHVPAIIEAWQPGAECGNAIADVVFGKVNPSGKLPMSFPRTVGQCPISYNCFNTGRPSNDDPESPFWSGYSDCDNSPLFAFGYGLSYTTFEYSNLSAKADGENIKVSVSVKNSGKVDGAEVVQLYIHDMSASIVRPVKELKAFDKIDIKAGCDTTINFTLTPKELGFYMPDGEFRVEKGDFEIMIDTLKVNCKY